MKRLLKLADGNHNNTWLCPGYFQFVSKFIQEVRKNFYFLKITFYFLKTCIYLFWSSIQSKIIAMLLQQNRSTHKFGMWMPDDLSLFVYFFILYTTVFKNVFICLIFFSLFTKCIRHFFDLYRDMNIKRER